MKISIAIPVALALLSGMALSDYVSYQGFPFEKHLVELQHDGSPAANFRCNKLASVLGENLSVFDTKTGQQANCYIVATGSVDEAGNFHGRLGWSTWVTRASNWSDGLVIPATDIKAIRSAWRG